jgi:hypothetical protein
MNVDLAAQRAFDRLAKVGLAELTDAERTVATVWLFDARVANGGLAAYYSSTAGDLALYAPRALTDIGAVQMAAIAARANAVFGPEGPPREHGARRERVRGLSDDAKRELDALEVLFYDCPDDLDELLETYLIKGSVA